MMELCHITAGYGGPPVLRDVSLAFEPGKVTVLAGPNGCGKSTLLRVAARLMAPERGEVRIAGQDVSRPVSYTHLTIAALVLGIVVELLRRNCLGQSFGGNVQLCGILFLWMAFIGLIPRYRDSGLMRLDFLVARTKGPVYEVLYFANKLFSLLLGVVMVVAFAAQYPYVSTRTYSTFPIPVPYTVQYFPMCLAGAYMALESLRQMAEHVAEKARGSRAQV